MSEPRTLDLPPAAAPPRRWRKWVVLGVCLALLFVVPVGAYFGIASIAERDLRAAIEETDRLDPGWRLHELEAKRPTLADEENAGLTVAAVRRLLPELWPPPPPQNPNPKAAATAPLTLYGVDEYLSRLDPEAQLDEPRTQVLRDGLAQVAPAVAEARKLVEMPRGRYTVQWTKDVINTLLPHTDHCRTVARLLQLDATLRAQDGDADGALLDGRAVVNVGRSLGEEPLAISQLVRLACQAIAVRSMERTLAQGQPSPAELAVAQEALEREAAENILLVMYRGERADQHELMEALKKGDLKFTQLTGPPGAGGGGPPAVDFVMSKTYVSAHAWGLRHLNEAVEVAKLPFEEREPRLQNLETTIRGRKVPLVCRLLLPAIHKLGSSCQRVQAYLRCAVAALAAERYRQANDGRWPTSLEALVGDQGPLREVPIDPYNGRPLRYRILPDGVVIYALGSDGTDEGGKGDRERSDAKGTDLAFRLWNVDRRRQPAAEPLALPKEGPPEEGDPAMAPPVLGGARTQ